MSRGFTNLGLDRLPIIASDPDVGQVYFRGFSDDFTRRIEQGNVRIIISQKHAIQWAVEEPACCLPHVIHIWAKWYPWKEWLRPQVRHPSHADVLQSTLQHLRIGQRTFMVSKPWDGWFQSSALTHIWVRKPTYIQAGLDHIRGARMTSETSQKRQSPGLLERLEIMPTTRDPNEGQM